MNKDRNLSGKGTYLSTKKQKPIRDKAAAEEEASQIRTRKVRFTGGGFAFPTEEGAEKKTEKKNEKKPSGRDAIIVEGRPGQANMKKQEITPVTPQPEAAAPKSAAGKKNTGKKSAAKKPKNTREAAKEAGKEQTPAKEQLPAKGQGSDKSRKKAQSTAKKPKKEQAAVKEQKKEQAAVKEQKKEQAPVKEQKKEQAAAKEQKKEQAAAKKQKNTPSPAKEPTPAAEQTPAVEQKKSPSGRQAQKKRNNKEAKKEAKPEPIADNLQVLPAEGPKKPSDNKGDKKKNKGRRKAKKPAEAAVTEPAILPAVPENVGIPAEEAKTVQAAEEARRQNSSRSDSSRQDGKKSLRGDRKKRTAPQDHKKTAGKHPSDLTLECRFSYSGRGFGFAAPVDPAQSVGEDIYISARNTMGAMTGDLVQVRVFRYPDRGHSAEGEVTAVLERSVDTITGRLVITPWYAAVKPDRDKLRILAWVDPEQCRAMGLQSNTKVEIVPVGEEHFSRNHSITVNRPKKVSADQFPYFDTRGEVTHVFGNADSREANYAAILHTSGIRTEFPSYVLQAAEVAASQPLSAAGRVDLRDRVIFTIDGADAKDLDDAISLTKNADGDWVLGVHIADVSHYVPYESCVEKEARLRGTSVYFTDKVVPMLPKALSNEACSLNAGTDKYALSCEITLTPDGQRRGTEIYKSILRSTVRGVYSEVNDLFANGDASPFREKYAAACDTLLAMRELYQVLKKRSSDRGVMELADAEAKIVLNEEGFPIEITRRERGDGEKMIEQFMLQANMGVAEVLRAKGLPCLYRIHEEPDKEKLQGFAVYAHNLGLPTFGISAEHTGDGDGLSLSEKLMGILAEANKREIGDIVSSVLLRSMMKAKYVAEPKPHFGLGAENYCHFTSPIRRYPDLFVHNVLTAVLPYTADGHLRADTVLPPEAVPQILAAAAPERGVSSTDCEITAQTAERKIEDLYMALYMSDKLGQVFDVMVTSVLKFGIFVQCGNLVEGLIPAPLFPDAVVNESLCTLRSEGAIYTLGTRMQARLVEADPASGRITFAPVFDTAADVD